MQFRTADTFTDSFNHASPMRRMTPIWRGGIDYLPQLIGIKALSRIGKSSLPPKLPPGRACSKVIRRADTIRRLSGSETDL
jgi:hypothetical protein